MAILAALPLLRLSRHGTSFTGSKGRVGGCISIGAGGIPHQKLAVFPLGQTNLICFFSSAPASASNTPLQLSLLPFASGTPPINAINNHVMSRETSLMASAHGHLNNEVMNNNRPPAPKFRKWLMRNNKSSLSGLMYIIIHKICHIYNYI